MAARYWFGGTGNWNDTAHWGAASNGSGAPASVPGTGDAANFDANSGGGTCTVNIAIDIQHLNLTGYTGTLDVGANNVNLRGVASLVTFSDTSGTHTLNMGSGAWTVTAISNSGGLWTINNGNLTFNQQTASLTLTPFTGGLNASVTFGTKTYTTVSLGAGHWLVVTGGTFTGLNLTAGTSMVITTGQTLAFGANPQTWTGTMTAPIVFVSSSPQGTAGTMTCSSGTMSLDWGHLGRIVGSGGATFSATNSVSYGGATGWSVSAPSAAGGGGVIGG